MTNLIKDKCYQVIKVREVIIVKEVKRSVGWWLFACGNVFLSDYNERMPEQIFLSTNIWIFKYICHTPVWDIKKINVYGHQDKHPVSTFSELQDWSCEGGSLFIKIGQLETYQHRSECNLVHQLKSNHKWENSVKWENTKNQIASTILDICHRQRKFSAMWRHCCEQIVRFIKL